MSRWVLLRCRLLQRGRASGKLRISSQPTIICGSKNAKSAVSLSFTFSINHSLPTSPPSTGSSAVLVSCSSQNLHISFHGSPCLKHSTFPISSPQKISGRMLTQRSLPVPIGEASAANPAEILFSATLICLGRGAQACSRRITRSCWQVVADCEKTNRQEMTGTEKVESQHRGSMLMT